MSMTIVDRSIKLGRSNYIEANYARLMQGRIITEVNTRSLVSQVARASAQLNELMRIYGTIIDDMHAAAHMYVYCIFFI